MPLRLRALDRLLLAELLRLFVATLGGVVLIYLVIDFADRGSSYHGKGWLLAATELYANKATVVSLQLAPAAWLIAAALLIAQLDRRGELTAMLSLGVRPARLCAPIAVSALLLGCTIGLVEDKVGVFASARADEISATRFGRWIEWGSHGELRWVRGKEGRLFHLGDAKGAGFEPASILEVDERFRLTRRIDAQRLEETAPGHWRLLSAIVRSYPESAEGQEPRIEETRLDELRLELPDKLASLALRSGRPRHLPWSDLRSQAELRRAAGQPDVEYRAALAERAAQPFIPIPASLAAVGFTLRRRKGKPQAPPVASSLVLALLLVFGLWALTVIAHAVVVGGTLPPWCAGALPLLASALGAALSLASAV